MFDFIFGVVIGANIGFLIASLLTANKKEE